MTLLTAFGLFLIALLVLAGYIRRRMDRPDLLDDPDPITRREPFDASKR